MLLGIITVIFINTCKIGLALFGMHMFRHAYDNSMDDGRNEWYNILFVHANLLHILIVLLLLLVRADTNENFGLIASFCVICLVTSIINGLYLSTDPNGIEINKNNYIAGIKKLKLSGLKVNDWNKYKGSVNLFNIEINNRIWFQQQDRLQKKSRTMIQETQQLDIQIYRYNDAITVEYDGYNKQ